MARRSLASTTPADVPSSRGAWLSDRPGWCVDLGPTLVAMTTCDLWLALAKGDSVIKEYLKELSEKKNAPTSSRTPNQKDE